MKERTRGRPLTDRLIVAGIALFLVLGLVLLGWAWKFIGDRAEAMTDEALESHMSAVMSRLDGWFGAWGTGMNAEAAYIAAHDSLDQHILIDRWRSMMNAYWPVTAVRLADEHGGEIALLRNDTGYATITTGMDRSPESEADSARSVRTPHLASDGDPDRLYDPRRQSWFSQALQNRSVDPVWSDPTDHHALHLSQLIRPSRKDLPYRILQLEIDPYRAGSALFGRTRARDAWIAFLPPSSDPILLPPTTVAPEDSTALHAALDRWAVGRGEQAFTVGEGRDRWQCWFRPFVLNGLQAMVGVMVPRSPWERTIRPARALAIGGFLVVLAVAALLITAYVRKQRDRIRLQAQEERSREQRSRLAKALGERDVLDREVHHRVKNNLQVVSSLLNLQAQRLEEGPVKEEFMRGKQRIDTMALVHHKLYGLPDLRGIDLNGFFNELVRTMHALHEPRSNTVSCQVDTAGSKADTDTAIELGIILCELVANCYQHAFPYATGGHIDVSVRLVERDLHRLIVKDNGRGLGADTGKGQAKLGLEIVEALAGQLDGSFHIRSNGGVTFEVLFRMDPVQ